jgi:flagellum-specific ATP synthase
MVGIIGNLAADLQKIPEFRLYGRVTAVQGMMVEIGGVERALSIGDSIHLQRRRGERVSCEVVGFREGSAIAMPFGELEGSGIGSRAEIADADPVVYPGDAWLGRVIDAMG